MQDVAKSLTIEHSTFNQSGGLPSSENKNDETSMATSTAQNNKNECHSNIFVWGSNAHGQLALSDETPLVQDPVAISLS